MSNPQMPPGSSELASLLRLAAGGDESAWREIINLYGRRVYAMARSRCRRDDLAEEIAQSVFVTVASKLGTGQYIEQGRFESWLFRVTMNRVRDEIRRQRRHAEPTDPSSFSETAAHTTAAPTDELELQSLRSAMDHLTEPDREVVELRHHGGLSFNQIAELLEQPVGTVLARHHRALKKLKDWITSASSQSESAPRKVAS